jgi:hypothetical protein
MVLLSKQATIGPIAEPTEQLADQTWIPVLLNQANINKWTTLPLPTVQQWQLAVTRNHNLKQMAKALKTQTPLVKQDLLNKEWH